MDAVGARVEVNLQTWGVVWRRLRSGEVSVDCDSGAGASCLLGALILTRPWLRPARVWTHLYGGVAGR